MSPLTQATIFKRYLLSLTCLAWASRLLLVAVLSTVSLMNGVITLAVALGGQEMSVLAATETGYDWRAAAAWLIDQQLPDGGFLGPSGESDPETTIDAVMAAYALGSRIPPSQLLEQARSYLLAHGLEYAASGPGEAAKLALAVIALGDDPGAFGAENLVCTGVVDAVGGVSLIARMTEPRTEPIPGTVPGLYGDDLRDHALVLIALSAAYEPVPEAASELFLATQGQDGGWAADGSTDPGAADARTTALVLQALAQTQYWDQPVVRRGLEFLRLLQAPEGGFSSGKVEPLVADAASTGQVIRALIASGEDPSSMTWGDAPQALALFQTEPGGFRASLDDVEPSLQATLQAIPALEEKPLPVAEMCTT